MTIEAPKATNNQPRILGGNHQTIELLNLNREQLHDKLRKAEPGSVNWNAVLDELHRRYLECMVSTLDRAEKSTSELATNVGKLVNFAGRLDQLTKALVAFTVVLVVLTVFLIIKEFV